ncbi:PAZ domain-containing protein [Tanacetum coccineum]
MITIKFAKRKELDHLRQFLAGRQQDNPQDTIQVLDVVLRKSASKDHDIVEISLFHTDFERGPLGDGTEDFYEPKLLSEFVGEFLGKDMSRPLTDQDRIKLNFIDETGATKTVVQYFREKYNVQLHFLALPSVQAGTDAKPTYLPIEICWVIPGQRYALKLNEDK